MKIPFIIKFNNTKAVPLKKNEVIGYFLRALDLNLDDLYPVDSYSDNQHIVYTKDFTSKQESFIAAMQSQFALLSACQLVHVFEELKDLKRLAPKGFAQDFDDIKIYLSKDTFGVEKIKSQFSDATKEILAHNVGGVSVSNNTNPDSLYARYHNLLTNIFHYDYEMGAMLRKTAQDRYQDVRSTSTTYQISELFDMFFLNPISTFSLSPVKKANELFLSTFQENVKNNLDILPERSYLEETRHRLYGFSVPTQIVIPLSTPIEKIENAVWGAFNTAYPNLAIQVERQRLKSLTELQLTCNNSETNNQNEKSNNSNENSNAKLVVKTSGRHKI